MYEVSLGLSVQAVKMNLNVVGGSTVEMDLGEHEVSAILDDCVMKKVATEPESCIDDISEFVL